jgi:Skp family chaperone for outer membrane proteins
MIVHFKQEGGTAMDRFVGVFLMFMIAGSISLVVSSSAQAENAATTGKEPAVQTKEDGKETWIKGLKKELDDLDKKAEALDAKARSDIAKQSRQFKKDHQAAVKKLDALKADASRKWEDVKPELEAAVSDLKRAFEKLRSTSEEAGK